jgi:putative chitinase
MVMKLTEQALKAIYPVASMARIRTFLPHLETTFDEFDINTPLRMAHFLAQVGHESGQLRYVRELASGEAYEGRLDLGNTLPGDGVIYKGRGLIQITGRYNYVLCGLALDLPLLEKPELLEESLHATRSAGWFWSNKNLNSLADLDDLVKITKLVNGGLNGLADRTTIYNRARSVL